MFILERWCSCSSSRSADDMQLEATRYVAEYIAAKHRSAYPQLGTNTPLAMDTQTLPTWIQLMNRGGLTTPTDSFLVAVQRLDVHFDTYQGVDTLHTCIGVVASTVSFLCTQSDCADLPREVITPGVKYAFVCVSCVVMF